MINSIEDLRSGGVLPTGPVSAWPKERNVAGAGMEQSKPTGKVQVGASQMARNLAQSAMTGIKHGRVSREVKEERMATCKSCPFLTDTNRCELCGCYMEAKTWLNGKPAELCPKNKWAR